jgi:hypothetical protein
MNDQTRARVFAALDPFRLERGSWEAPGTRND